MCRLSSATDRRAFRLLVAALSVVPLAILLALALAPLPARAETPLPRLHSVTLKAAEYPPDVRTALGPGLGDKSYENLTMLAIPEPLFHLTFTEGERFQFILPISILYDSGGFGSRGATQYAYTLRYADGSTLESTIPVPNKLLRIRDALLAAEDYWNKAAERSGHRFELSAPAEPIDVNIGYFVDEQTMFWYRLSGLTAQNLIQPGTEPGQMEVAPVAAYARPFSQEIRVRHDLDEKQLETTPIHELFHILTNAVLRAEFGSAAHYQTWLFISRDVARLLFESTARWSEDEPITVPAGAGGAPSLDIDTLNDRDCDGSYTESGTDLFERDQYCVFWLIKYYVEQIAGGSDTAKPEVVLDLIARAAKHNRLTKDTFIQALAEGLPADRFPGATWQERWQRFYTSFAAAVLARRPSVAGGAGSQLAFHDDAFAAINHVGPFFPMGAHWMGYSRVPKRIYETPAADDAERAERLATIAETVELPPFASLYNVLELNALMNVVETQDLDYPVPRPVEARSVFVYARGPEGTNAFLLRQHMTGFWDWAHRNFGSLKRMDSFSLVGSDGAVVGEQKDIPASGGDNVYVNLGLVNPGPASASREMSWAYLAAPRLIPTPTRSRLFDFQKIAPVRLVGGSAHDAGRRDQLENGDSFVFEVTVNGKLHLGTNAREDIPEDERTIQLAIVCGGDDRPVLLAEEDGRTIGVAAKLSPRDGPDDRFFYLLSGRIDPENTVTGDCRVRVELTSLLNLGSGDRQVDESLAVRVVDTRPTVQRMQITSGDTVVYDTEGDIRHAAEAVDGAYDLDLKVWFSTEASPLLTEVSGASVTAGFNAPYDTYPAKTEEAPAANWSTWVDPDDPSVDRKSVLETSITIPEGDAPNGGFLWFSVSATSVAGVTLDGDPVASGDQPDTRHFALLDLDDYYLVTLSAENNWSLSYSRRLHIDSDGDRSWSSKETQVQYRPFEAQFRLMPWAEAEDYHARMGSLRAPLLLESWQRMMEAVRQPVTEIEPVLAENKARLRELEDAVRSHGTAGWMQEEMARLRPRIERFEEEIRARESELETLHGYEEDLRVLIRLIRNARSYRCDFDNPGPIPARFGGMDQSHQEQGWHDHWGADGDRWEDAMTANAPAWQNEDALSLGWREMRVSSGHLALRQVCPWLEVWDYDPADFARARELLATPPLESIGPDFGAGVEIFVGASALISTLPPTTIDYPNSVTYTGLQLAPQGSVELRQAFGDIFRDALVLVTNAAWRFAFRDESVVDFNYDGYDRVATQYFEHHEEPMRLPTLPRGPLFRLGYSPNGLWPWPMVDGEYHGTRSHRSSARPGPTYNFEEVEDRRFTTVVSDDNPRMDWSGIAEPLFDGGGFSIGGQIVGDELAWTLDAGTERQVTNWTLPDHILAGGPGLVVQGHLPGTDSSGGITGEGHFIDQVPAFFEDQEHRREFRYRWTIERNASPGLPDREPETPEVAQIPDSPDSPDPENEDPDGDPTEGNGEGAGEEAGTEQPDDPDDPDEGENTAGTTGTRREETPVPPGASEPSAGWPVTATVMPPTIQYPGVVQGIITNGSDRYEPGHVALYLTGDGLPPPDGEPLQMELNAGFPQSFVGIPVGGAIRFHNGEGAGGPPFHIFTGSALAEIDHVINPGEEAVISFEREGRLTVRSHDNSAHVLEVIVLPSTRFNVLNTMSYIIRDVPPGRYMLRARIENRRYQPLAIPIEVPAVGRATINVTLVERGALASAGPNNAMATQGSGPSNTHPRQSAAPVKRDLGPRYQPGISTPSLAA